MKRLLAISLLLPALALADIEFDYIDGSELGIEPVLADHRAAYKEERNGDPRLWSSLGWCDASGCYLYAGFHNANTTLSSGYIWRQSSEGWQNVTPNGQTPAGSRPVLVDINGDGFKDLINGDDECSNCTSLLSNGDGTFTYSPGYTLRWGSNALPEDVDGDGDIDLVEPTRYARNDGDGFTVIDISLDEQLAPINNAEAEARARDAAQEDLRFSNINVYEIGDAHMITWAGSYAGDTPKWTMVVRNGEVIADIAGQSGRPQLLNGDWVWILRNGKYEPENGVYYYNSAVGKLDIPSSSVERWIGNGAYMWALYVADFNGDGCEDFALGGRLHNRSYILECVGARTYSLAETLKTVTGQPLWVGDVNGDGSPDVTYATFNNGERPWSGGGFGVLINQSGGVAPPPPPPINDAPDPVSDVLTALEAAASAIVTAQGCAASADSDCTQTAIDSAQQALWEGEQSLPFP